MAEPYCSRDPWSVPARRMTQSFVDCCCVFVLVPWISDAHTKSTLLAVPMVLLAGTSAFGPIVAALLYLW